MDNGEKKERLYKNETRTNFEEIFLHCYGYTFVTRDILFVFMDTCTCLVTMITYFVLQLLSTVKHAAKTAIAIRRHAQTPPTQ